MKPMCFRDFGDDEEKVKAPQTFRLPTQDLPEAWPSASEDAWTPSSLLYDGDQSSPSPLMRGLPASWFPDQLPNHSDGHRSSRLGEGFRSSLRSGDARSPAPGDGRRGSPMPGDGRCSPGSGNGHRSLSRPGDGRCSPGPGDGRRSPGPSDGRRSLSRPGDGRCSPGPGNGRRSLSRPGDGRCSPGPGDGRRSSPRPSEGHRSPRLGDGHRSPRLSDGRCSPRQRSPHVQARAERSELFGCPDIRLSRIRHGGVSGVRLAELDLSAGAIVAEFELQQTAKFGIGAGDGGAEGRGLVPGAGSEGGVGCSPDGAWPADAARGGSRGRRDNSSGRASPRGSRLTKKPRPAYPRRGVTPPRRNLLAIPMGAAANQALPKDGLRKGPPEQASPEAEALPRSGKGAGKGALPPPPTLAPPKAPGKGAPPGKAPGKGPGKGLSTTGKVIEPRKPDVRPGVNCKKLYWSSFRLTDPESNTVWAAIEREEAHIDTARLETLFADDPSGSRALAAQADNAKRGPRTRKIQVLGNQRRRQICVMMARLPHPEIVREAIMLLDFTQLTKEQVELLLLNVPSHEEIQVLRHAENEQVVDENNAWDSAEEFIFMLLSVPHYKLRLQLWDFENTFREQFESIAERQRDIMRGCDCVLTSRAIRHLLGLVLVVGNYLNGGTLRGRADGFAIDTLIQVRMVKTSSKDPAQAEAAGTLVDYLVQQMEAQYPCEVEEMLAPAKDAEKIRRASRPKLEEITEELRAFMTKADGILQMVRATTKGLEEEDVFLQHGEIMAMCLAELEELQLRHKRVLKKYSELCVYFHMEDSTTKKACDEFFGVWDQFMQDVDKSRMALLKQEREVALRSRRSLSLGPRRGRSRGAPAPEQGSEAVPTGDAAPPKKRSFSLGPRRSGSRRPTDRALDGAGRPYKVAVFPATELARIGAAKAARSYLAELAETCAELAAQGPARAALVLAARGYVAELAATCAAAAAALEEPHHGPPPRVVLVPPGCTMPPAEGAPPESADPELPSEEEPAP